MAEGEVVEQKETISALAAVGRKQIELDAMHEQYNMLLLVLHKIAVGEIKPDEMSVDLNTRSWKYDKKEPVE